ncbi:MAG: hypothetical protein NZO58_14535, partial [Gemmataceae bacterium]|nr:hypothetical protein [Gemmataceae bacterium]
DTTVTGDPLLERLRLSFHPDHSGDVMIVPQPYHVVSGPATSEKNAAYRTTHGSPHPYDTHVPLIVMGPDVEAGRREDRVAPQALAAILAESLGVPPPGGAIFPVPPGTFKKHQR